MRAWCVPGTDWLHLLVPVLELRLTVYGSGWADIVSWFQRKAELPDARDTDDGS